VTSNTTRLLVRNVSHLGVGQVVSTGLGIVLASVVGRALEPAQLGSLYIVIAISSYVYIFVEWGQSTYLVREMARGRADEAELIGSAILFRLIAVLLSSGVAVAVALSLGYGSQIAMLTLLAVVVGVPGTLLGPFSCSFRARDRMDLDVLVNVLGKAMILVAIIIALRFGGGLPQIILMQGIGGVSSLLGGLFAARRIGIAARAPAARAMRELLFRGAPITAFSLVIASQGFIEIMMLSAFTNSTVVGWYGASRTIFGTVISPAMIMLGATFPELSRASRSLPDFRRMIDITGRVLFIAAAFSSSALYLFADDLVAIIYGHGRLEQAAVVLRVSAIFIPLGFFGLVLGAAMTAVGRNNAMAVISFIKLIFCALLSYIFISYWQQRFGNGGIALVIIAGLAEIPLVLTCLVLLPKGAVASSTTGNLFRACVASVCTVGPLSMLKPLGLFYVIPMFLASFAVVAIVFRLILPSDLRLAMGLVRSRSIVSEPTNPASDGQKS
jgi:O-antigen/teichoic acid export membrane protein